jgi:hypothetical protein
MENLTKSMTEAPGALASTLATWARQGMESFVATQKILLDLTAQQNSLAIGFVRERVNFSPLRPLTGMVELAGHSMAHFVAAQTVLLDLVTEENTLFQAGLKEGLGLTGVTAAVTDAMRDGVTAFAGMQKKFLDIAARQTTAAVEAIKEGKTFDGKNLAEVARESVENFVHTQKKILDLVAEVAQPRANGNGRKALKPADRRKVVQLVKAGMDAFVASQKQLLDLATKQIESTMKTAGEMVRPSPEPSTSAGEVARRGVENFINAQKSLLDVAIKPFMPPPARTHTPVHAHAGRRK